MGVVTKRVLWPSAVFMLIFLVPGAIGAADFQSLPAIPTEEPPQPSHSTTHEGNVVDDILGGNGAGNGNGGGSTGIGRDLTEGRTGTDVIADEIRQSLEDPVVVGVTIGGVVASIAIGLALASRYIDPTVALSNPQRSMLYGFIKGNPGVHLKQLSGEFKMKTSTVLWHVRKLESADLVRSKKANGYRVFYPVSGGIEASKLSEAVTALSNGNARSVFSFVAERADAHVRELAQALVINPGTLRWHLKKLRQAGLLEEIPEAPDGAVRVTHLGLKAWTQIQALPPTLTVQAVSVSGDVKAEEQVPANG